MSGHNKNLTPTRFFVTRCCSLLKFLFNNRTGAACILSQKESENEVWIFEISRRVCFQLDRPSLTGSTWSSGLVVLLRACTQCTSYGLLRLEPSQSSNVEFWTVESKNCYETWIFMWVASWISKPTHLGHDVSRYTLEQAQYLTNPWIWGPSKPYSKLNSQICF